MSRDVRLYLDGDVLARGYFALDEEIVWDVVRTKLGPLAVEVWRIAEEQG